MGRISTGMEGIEKKHQMGSTILRFLKDWTLPVSMSIGTIVYLFFAMTPQLESASRFFEPIFNDILPLFMFLILFVTFCKVDFHQMRLEWWHFWVSLFQILFVLVVVAIILLGLGAGDTNGKILWEGILCCIIGPCAAAAAVVTTKLGGNLSSMTTYTFLSNFITALLIPTFFPLIEKSAHITFLTAFWIILQRVAMILVVPLIMGWFVKHYMHRFHRRIISIPDLGFYLWGISLTIVTGTTVKNIVNSQSPVSLLLGIAVVSLFLCILQFAVGKHIGHFFQSTINAGQALGQKNTAFAIWIAYTYLNPVASVGPGCYILWQNIVNSWELWMQRKKEE